MNPTLSDLVGGISAYVNRTGAELARKRRPAIIAQIGEFGVNKNHRLIDVHINKPFHNAQLRRGNGPAEMVTPATVVIPRSTLSTPSL